MRNSEVKICVVRVPLTQEKKNLHQESLTGKRPESLFLNQVYLRQYSHLSEVKKVKKESQNFRHSCAHKALFLTTSRL